MGLVLIVSIFIRLVGMGWSVVMLWQFRDWRMVFLILLFGLMALDQAFVVFADSTAWPPTLDGTAAVLPGFFVSIIALLMMVYVKRFFVRIKQTPYDPDRLLIVDGEPSSNTHGLAFGNSGGLGPWNGVRPARPTPLPGPHLASARRPTDRSLPPEYRPAPSLFRSTLGSFRCG